MAGFAGVVGGTALSISPGEDTRYLLASLVVVIVGGMGSITGAAVGALLIGLAEQFGLAYAPTYGVVFTFVIMAAGPRLPAAGYSREASMSAAQWRRAMNSGAGRRHWSRAPIAATGVQADAAITDTRSAASCGRARFARCAAIGARHVVVLLAVLALPLGGHSVLHLPDRRPGAGARPDRAVAHLPRRLWRHGLARADDRRRSRRLHGGDLRHREQRMPPSASAWPWWLAVPSRVRDRAPFSPPSSAGSRCAPRASTRS